MKPPLLRTIKVSDDAQRLLKLVTALTGEKFYYQVLERVLQAEVERLAPGLERPRHPGPGMAGRLGRHTGTEE